MWLGIDHPLCAGSGVGPAIRSSSPAAHRRASLANALARTAHAGGPAVGESGYGWSPQGEAALFGAAFELAD
jgi:hypothetical protein